MASDSIIKALARQPIFQGLTNVQLGAIASRAEHLLYHPGTVIIEENAVGDGAVLIVTGEAARVSGPELSSRLEPVPAGSLLGESAMLVETSHGSTVVARTNVRALFIARETLHAQMTEDPSIADQLAQNMAGRLRQLAADLRRVDAILAGEDADGAAPYMLPTSQGTASLPASLH
jgi:CRP-like cAMP-binding protein